MICVGSNSIHHLIGGGLGRRRGIYACQEARAVNFKKKKKKLELYISTCTTNNQDLTHRSKLLAENTKLNQLLYGMLVYISSQVGAALDISQLPNDQNNEVCTYIADACSQGMHVHISDVVLRSLIYGWRWSVPSGFSSMDRSSYPWMAIRVVNYVVRPANMSLVTQRLSARTYTCVCASDIATCKIRSPIMLAK